MGHTAHEKKRMSGASGAAWTSRGFSVSILVPNHVSLSEMKSPPQLPFLEVA